MSPSLRDIEEFSAYKSYQTNTHTPLSAEMSGHHQLLVWCILISYQSWFFDRILMYSSLCQMLAVYFVNFVGVLFLLAGLFSMPHIRNMDLGVAPPSLRGKPLEPQVNYRMSLLLHPFSDDGRTTSQV